MTEPPADPIDWGAALAVHASWLRMVVLARVRDAAAAEEVLQEVSLAVLAQRAPLMDSTRLAPWLYQIAIRQALRHRRQHARGRRRIEEFARRMPAETGPAGDPLTWLLADEQAEMVQVALAQLPAREAEMLLLKHTQRWSYRELAMHLGTSEAAVDSRLHRARARLRKILLQMGMDERT